jgi:hypothetical protein
MTKPATIGKDICRKERGFKDHGAKEWPWKSEDDSY